MNIICFVVAVLLFVLIRATIKRENYINRKEYDQRFNVGKRKGVEW